MRALFILAVLSCVVGGAACAPVAPYERERLALPGMRLAPDAESDAEQHQLESREGSAGGYGAVGGGCGCN